jgi:phosphoglycerate dehydrogenase-like enzyme
MENVIITPHAGGRSFKEFDRLCALFVENLRRYHQGLPLVNVVSLDDG